MVSRWYSIGQHRNNDEIVILGWSRDRSNALARTGTIEAYYASSRKSAAARAKAEDKSRQRRELAKWEILFARLGVKGVQVTQVFRHDNGLQVYGRLGKATADRGFEIEWRTR